MHTDQSAHLTSSATQVTDHAVDAPSEQADQTDRVICYEGALRGAERGTGPDGCWAFEGRSYDTPATEDAVLETVAEALEEPDDAAVDAAHDALFRGPTQYTAQLLSALAAAYEREVGDGEGCDPVTSILREAARRIAVIEALTV